MICSTSTSRTSPALQRASKLLALSLRFIDRLQSLITWHSIPAALLSLPPHLTAAELGGERATPIVPVFTSAPRRLSAHLRARGMNARPITWPTVPKGLDRVRVCLHADNSLEEVDGLARAMVEWATGQMPAVRAQERTLSLQSKL